MSYKNKNKRKLKLKALYIKIIWRLMLQKVIPNDQNTRALAPNLWQPVYGYRAFRHDVPMTVDNLRETVSAISQIVLVILILYLHRKTGQICSKRETGVEILLLLPL